MAARKKTWADIMSDDESDEENPLLKSLAGGKPVEPPHQTEDTYLGPLHADAEQSQLGLNGALDAMECSSRMQDDPFLTPFPREKRQRSKEEVHTVKVTPGPKRFAKEGNAWPKGSPKAKVARTDEDAPVAKPKAAWGSPDNPRKPVVPETPPKPREEGTPVTMRPAARTPAALVPSKPAKAQAPATPPAMADKVAATATPTESHNRPGYLPPATEVDWERRKEQRQKQIDIGKKTEGYIQYKQLHPQRKPNDPATPKADSRKDRRDWNLDLKLWRTFLHKFDPPAQGEELAATGASKVDSPADAKAGNSADAPADTPVPPCA